MAAVIKPRLEELPEELISNIVIKLDTDSSLAFRLTCRNLQHRSIHEWASEYFAHKAIIPSSGSLKVLASIAESKKLRGYLHHIYIIPALFSARVFNCCHGRSCKWRHTTRQEEAMHSYVEDQEFLRMKGSLLERFTHIFKQLPNLHALTFADSFSSVPAEVNIIGYASFARKTNNTLTTLPLYPEDTQYYAWKRYVWKTMMRAIASSEITTLKTLTSRLDNMKNPLTLSDLTFNAETLHRLRKALRSLETVRLQLTSGIGITGDEVTFDKEQAVTVMDNLASLMPSIMNLDLSLSYDRPSLTMCKALASGVALEKLTTLRLDGVYMDSKFLSELITTLTGAENLYLEFIRLTKGTWPTVLAAMLKLKKLKHLHLHLLAVPTGSACFLKPLEQNDAPRDDTQDPWGGFPLFGAGAGNGANGAGAAAGHAVPDADGLIWGSDEDDEDDEDDDGYSEDEDNDEDEDEDDDYSDDSMPELEPQDAAPPPDAKPQPQTIPLLPTASANQASETALADTAAPAHSLSTLYSDSDAETNDSMPDLEPATGGTSSQAAAQPLQTPQPPAASTNNSNHFHNNQSYDGHHNTQQGVPDPNSLESRLGKGLERGRVICLNSAKEIQEQLPKFMKEYHIVDDEMEDDIFGGFAMPLHGPGGAVVGGAMGMTVGGGGNGQGAGPVPLPPPAINNILNNLFQQANGNNGPGAPYTLHGPFFGPAPPPAPAATGATPTNAQNATLAPAGNPFAACVEEDDESWEDLD